MKLGAFSISLNVKDINASKQFYEHLGFTTMGGDITQNWLILKNGDAIIGLFQGMFEKNMITFNPGWDVNAQVLETYDDVREIQKHLKQNKITIMHEADSSNTGPAYISLSDPDGNVILIDQHI
jgi:catechol 2,3-dioxygenase-like lactoylglutathione lyase family enzyme